MIFDYSTAPMHLVEGVPANKFGEWPGKTSCKFSQTRRIIIPKSDGIIFNDNEPPLISKKKVSIQKPSPEIVFRPSLKIIRHEIDKKQKIESVRIIRPTPREENVVRAKKETYFKYQQDQVKELMKRNDSQDNNLIIKNELKHLSKVGFTKNVMDTLPNSKLMTFSLLKNFNTSQSFNAKTQSVNRKNEIVGSSSHYSWQKKEQEKLNILISEQDNLKKDINYVKTLKNWDTKFLPKI